MVVCSKCGSTCRHWIVYPKDWKGRVIGVPNEKHVNCPTCKEHWVYEKVEHTNQLVPRLIPQIEMF